MCGIVGYIGHKNAAPILIKGLKRVEYRGYDSSGIAILQNNEIVIHKKKGKVAFLEEEIKDKDLFGSIGISHTRWATHGEPNDENAHPHSNESGDISLVHNGIIENYAELKELLINKGHKFASLTDTEVLVHLIEEELKDNCDLECAVRSALKRIEGTYGLLVISSKEPDKIIAARKGSPLIIGIGKDEYFLASDAVPIVEYTKSVVYLDDYDLAIITKTEFILKTIENEIKNAEIKTVELKAEELEKSGFDHFMMKEIFDQPEAIENCLRGRINKSKSEVNLGGVIDIKDRLINARRIVIVACGSSWHAGLIGKYYIEELTGIPVEVDYASEFRYRNPLINENDILITLSQSGETADTYEALKLAKLKGAAVFGITNVIGSSIARETDAGIYTHAGLEICVATTKVYVNQIISLLMFALAAGQLRKTVTKEKQKELIEELLILSKKMKECLNLNKQAKELAKLLKDKSDLLYIGRGVNFPTALEGALKLKEISYIHAEGYPSGEMKHGPIALIDENMPIIALATEDKWYAKVISNIQEAKARKGIIIGITNEGNEEVKNSASVIFKVPKAHELLYPILNIIPLQLLSYHIANLKGINVDQPRNLAKSVTVE